jgi:4-aminobutyrate aminotransferase-like enzyme/Ser/Thr protein kinase RdoA (MazF antagonist)
MHLLQHTPEFSPEQALAIAREHYGLEGPLVSALPSERDQNFLLERRSGERFVLKIANALEDPGFLEAQHQVLGRLAGEGNFCPRVLASRSEAPLVTVTSPAGARHLARLVTYLPGAPLARVKRPSPELLHDLGRRLGIMDRVLASFDHPAFHRTFHWDLVHGVRVVREHQGKIADADLRTTVRHLAERFERDVSPLLPGLRRSVIHGDANDHNVIVEGGTNRARRHRRVTGFIDFGDMVYSCTAGNLAVAAAYVLLDRPDPLAAAALVVEGYHTEFLLAEQEIAALFGLICLRLCLSACHAADQERQRPDDAYLTVSQEPVRRTLPRLLCIHPRFAEALFRRACGWAPCRTSESVTRWLRVNAASLRPVLDTDLRTAPCLVFDLGVGSSLVRPDERENAEPLLTDRLVGDLRDAGVRVGVGRYDEPRLLYTTPLFATGASPLDERRTVHLGLDLFTAAGTPVYAPLAGAVHALADNAAAQDYGPVVVLQHRTEDGHDFFTLYGHLSRESLEALEVGQPIAAGQRLGRVGAAAVNGGWTPHLHFQLIADLLDLQTNFPGVAPPSQREVWLSLSPDPNLLIGIPAERFPPPEPTLAASLAARRRRLGRNLSVAYRHPLKIVRGWMQYLFDHQGCRYLDAYNNVPHVGHCHPRVVRAAQEQMAILNTNTRYLHDRVNQYAEELCATLPEPLSVCFFLNSASEANELALRLARAQTRQRDTIVLEAAYHGHTTTLIDVSPYKHAGPGGSGAPAWVHAAPIPDRYRGSYKYADPRSGEHYAAHVSDIIDRLGREGRGLAAFLAETCPSVGGQILLPEGYLQAVYRYVRAAGGVCIADEVQTGFGRLGTHFWGFEEQGVVPDIVVMGKPMGNGHPLAVAVTTAAIAKSFDNGMEFFSTFGGNAVSCAAGLAVLRVLREEGLQAHALRVGQRLLEGLRPFVQRHALVGDVRGAGLFLGVELVRDRQTLEPAGEEASLAVDRMRECGILLGTDGPFHNVIKIRPPMPFSEKDADLLVHTLDRILTEDLGGEP